MGGEGIGHLSDQFNIQACDSDTFIRVHGGKDERTKRFNRNADAYLSTCADGSQFVASQRVYELDGVIDKTASLQKNAEPRQEKRAMESFNGTHAHDSYPPGLDSS
jgi:hypothetical protein